MMSEDEEVTLREQIDNLQNQMLTYDGYSSEYIAMTKNLDILYKLYLSEKELGLKTLETESRIRETEARIKEIEIRILETEAKIEEIKTTLDRLDPEWMEIVKTFLPVVGNLVTVWSVLSFEKFNVITTKVTSFLMKMR